MVVPPSVLAVRRADRPLDVSLAATVLNLLGGCARELGMAILFVTHDLAVARVVADRIAVMYLGRIVEIGPAEGVPPTRAPVHEALLAAVPGPWSASPCRARASRRARSGRRRGCPFHPRCIRALPECQR